jgi:uncharacterized phage protein (TIGR01671 family)
MDRVIKFRGKTAEDNISKWVYGFFTKSCKLSLYKIRYQLKDSTWVEIEVIPETVGQYTGLKDKNDDEIYEGDVICVNKNIHKVVKFINDRAAFCLANIKDLKHEIWLDVWQ